MTDFPKLASIEVDPENPFYQSIDGVLYSKAGDTLIHCPHTRTSLHIPEGVTAIDVSAFRRCQELAEIVLPATLSTIRKRAFYCCESLANLVIPEGVISIGEEAFSNCKALKEVTLPSSLKEISPFAFSDCASLTKIVIPEGVTSIGDSAFSGCSSLTEVTLPKSLTVLGEMKSDTSIISSHSKSSGRTTATLFRNPTGSSIWNRPSRAQNKPCAGLSGRQSACYIADAGFILAAQRAAFFIRRVASGTGRRRRLCATPRIL